MYFPVLKELKEYDSEISIFDDILFNIYKKNYYKRFNPRVYAYFNGDIEEKRWINFLEELWALGHLETNFELSCPECDETIEIFNKYTEIPFDKEIECNHCFEEYIVDLNDIFVTYSFKNSFTPSDDSDKLISDEKGPIKPFCLDELIYPSPIFKRNIIEKRENLKCLLEMSIQAEISKEKGKFLEDLSQALFDVYPYLIFYKRNHRYDSGEIDVIFKVKTVPGTLFAQFSDVMIIECKNWKDKVGANEVRNFDGKLQAVDARVGVIVSKEGITGDKDYIRDAMRELKRIWDSRRTLIVVLTFSDLEKIISIEENMYDFLENKCLDIKIA